jgi:two-component system NarL family response regulator
LKLLVVDDHILFREGLVSLLSRQPDMQVLGEAGSVAEAVELSRRFKPDIILMVVRLMGELATGAPNRVIADRLVISENTVRNHVHNLLEKLGLTSRREAVNLARQSGLGKK